MHNRKSTQKLRALQVKYYLINFGSSKNSITFVLLITIKNTKPQISGVGGYTIFLQILRLSRLLDCSVLLQWLTARHH